MITARWKVKVSITIFTPESSAKKRGEGGRKPN